MDLEHHLRLPGSAYQCEGQSSTIFSVVNLQFAANGPAPAAPSGVQAKCRYDRAGGAASSRDGSGLGRNALAFARLNRSRAPAGGRDTTSLSFWHAACNEE